MTPVAGGNTGVPLRVGPRVGGVRDTPPHPSLQQLRHPCLLFIPVNVEAQALALNP